MPRINAAAVKGTRDYLPGDLVRRNRVFALLRDTFERYGYEPLETPAVESTTVLEGKYGEEGERLLFRVLKRGEDLTRAARGLREQPDAGATQGTVPGEDDENSENGENSPSAGALSRVLADMALRYDLTVPFARVIAAHQNDIVFPFRRYQMQPVWRAERPQRGRYREFYQCDVDCVGSRSVSVEAEMLAMVSEVLERLGFTDHIVRINHRALLAALMSGAGIPEERRTATLVVIDKLEKIGEASVRAELGEAGLTSEQIEALMRAVLVRGEPAVMVAELRETAVGASAEGSAALDDLANLFRYLEMLGVPAARYSFDVSTVRGLAYYTGIIYETFSAAAPVGSLASGGRYDKLIGMFLGRDLPCVGVSFGIDRIFAAMDILKIGEAEATTTVQALVTIFDESSIGASFAAAQALRVADIHTEVYAEPKKLRNQLTYAGDKHIPLVVIVGPDEAARGEVKLRDMRSGAEQTVALGDLATRAREVLGAEA